MGLVLASLNSLVVCVIGLHTAQFGFIPANLFCIGVYGLSIRSWLKSAAQQATEAAARAANK